MNKEVNISTLRKIADLIMSGSAAEAFSALRSFATASGQPRFMGEIDTLEQRYFYMLRFMVQGHADPSLDSETDSILASARQIADRIYRESNVDDSSALYYSTLRYRRLRPEESIATLAVDYLTELQNLRSDGESLLDSARNRTIEQYSRDIFNAIWTEFPLAADDSETIDSLLSDRSVPVHDRELWISAITLGLMEFFDTPRLELLSRAYSLPEIRLSVASATGMALVAFRYRFRRFDSRARMIFGGMAELPGWNETLLLVTIELLRSLDTDRISRKMKEDILPGMMKMGSAMMDKVRDAAESDETFSPEAMAENPEWEEMLHNNGMFDKLKEMNELQQEGADVFMGTFSNMRTFRFFNDMANWFLPYYPSHSSLADVADGEGVMICEMFARLPFLCDSDKYAILSAMAQTPASVRTKAMGQMASQYEAMSEAMGLSREEDMPEKDRRRLAANNYVKNIYRFYKLFRRKGEFFDPFSRRFSPLRASLFSGLLGDHDSLKLLAEFVFKTGLFREAAEFYTLLSGFPESAGDKTVWQKLGYSLEKTENLSAAIGAYRTALDLGESDWTRRRLASVLRRAGEKARAAEIYTSLSEAAPDDLSLAYLSGVSLIEAGRFSDAVVVFERLYYCEESLRSLRPLVWSLFMTGQTERADELSDKIIALGPNANDWLNSGHIKLALKEYPEAINAYIHSLDGDATSESLRKFAARMDSDSESLAEAAGISRGDISRIVDAVAYASGGGSFGVPLLP